MYNSYNTTAEISRKYHGLYNILICLCRLLNQLSGFLQKSIFYMHLVVPCSLIEQVSCGTMGTWNIFSCHLTGFSGRTAGVCLQLRNAGRDSFYKSLAKEVTFYLHRKGTQFPFHHQVFVSWKLSSACSYSAPTATTNRGYPFDNST